MSWLQLYFLQSRFENGGVAHPYPEANRVCHGSEKLANLANLANPPDTVRVSDPVVANELANPPDKLANPPPYQEANKVCHGSVVRLGLL